MVDQRANGATAQRGNGPTGQRPNGPTAQRPNGPTAGLRPSEFLHVVQSYFEGQWILFSAFTGALEVVDEARLNELETASAHPDEAPAEVVAWLRERGFLVDFDERYALRSKYHQKRENLRGAERAGLSLTIAPTVRCNFGCTYCFEKHPNMTCTGALTCTPATCSGAMTGDCVSLHVCGTQNGGCNQLGTCGTEMTGDCLKLRVCKDLSGECNKLVSCDDFTGDCTTMANPCTPTHDGGCTGQCSSNCGEEGSREMRESEQVAGLSFDMTFARTLSRG